MYCIGLKCLKIKNVLFFFSFIGETNNDDEHDAEDENNDELTSVFVESYEDESHISYRKNTIPFHNVRTYE